MLLDFKFMFSFLGSKVFYVIDLIVNVNILRVYLFG